MKDANAPDQYEGGRYYTIRMGYHGAAIKTRSTVTIRSAIFLHWESVQKFLVDDDNEASVGCDSNSSEQSAPASDVTEYKIRNV